MTTDVVKEYVSSPGAEMSTTDTNSSCKGGRGRERNDVHVMDMCVCEREREGGRERGREGGKGERKGGRERRKGGRERERERERENTVLPLDGYPNCLQIAVAPLLSQ